MRRIKPEFECRKHSKKIAGVQRSVLAMSVMAAVFVAATLVPNAAAATQVSQNGITWTFDKDYQTGTFVNGDTWVLDPGSGVVVTSVSPGRSGSGTSFRNGSVVNPSGGNSQGYDGRVAGFNSSLSRTFPLTLRGGDSLVSAVSRTSTSHAPDVTGYSIHPDHAHLQRAAVLTVVSQVPPSDAFRPPFAGTSKPIHRTSSLQWEQLPRLPLNGKPAASYVQEIAGWFRHPWLDHLSYWHGRMMHPLDNMPNYGREIGAATSNAAALLVLDYSDAELRPLLINFVQTGIDLYGMSRAGTTWPGDGGHSNGRKWPILFAGIMLNDSNMKNVQNAFGEDDQTYYGATSSNNPGQSHVAYWGRNCVSAYTSSCSGSGIKDCRPQNLNGDGCQDYRNCCTSATWVGQALAAQLMNQKSLWGHNAFFDYVDRWMGYGNDPRVGSGDWIQPGSTSASFINTMWNTYRPLVGNIEPQQPPVAYAGSDQTVTTTGNSASVQLSAVGSSASEGTIVAYSWAIGNTEIATGQQPTVTLAVGVHDITLTVIASNGLSATDSVRITVEQVDTTPPSITGVTANYNEVRLFFSEPLDTASATNTSNYAVSGGISVESISLNSNHTTAILTTSQLAPDLTYTLTVTGVKDKSGNAMSSTSVYFQFETGLISHLAMNEGSGDTVADASGSGNNGLIIGDAIWTNGTSDSGIQLTGSDQAVEVGLDTLTAGQGSAAVWAKIDSFAPAKQYIFGHVADGWANRIQLYIVGDGQLAVGLGDAHQRQTSIMQLATGRWYHFALTWNGGEWTLYVDGNEAAGGSYTGLAQVNNFADFGNVGHVNGRVEGLAGVLDEARIYSRAITADEAASLATTTIPYAFQPVPDQQVQAGETLSFELGLNVHDAELSIALHNLPSAPSLQGNVFSWTPGSGVEGTFSVMFAASHSGVNDTLIVTITVTAAPAEPDPDPEPDPQPADGLVAHLPLDEGFGGTAADISDSGNDATLVNGPTWTNGRVDGGLRFSSADHALQVPLAGLSTSAGTVAAWARADDLDVPKQYIFGHVADGWANRVQVYIERGGQLGVGMGDAHRKSNAIMQLEAGRWYHTALAWDNGAWTLMVDGEIVAGGSYTGLGEIHPFGDFGNAGHVNGRVEAFRGVLDEARVYNYPLDADEVAELIAEAGEPQPQPQPQLPDGLVSHLHMDDGSGSTVSDASGNGNDATLIAGPSWSDGRYNVGLLFDDIDQALQTPLDGLSTSEGSVAVWVRADSVAPAKQYLFGHVADGWNNRIQLYIEQQGWLGVGMGDTHQRATQVMQLATGRWYHVALTWNNGAWALYVDGQQVSGGNYSGLNQLHPFADLGNVGHAQTRIEAFAGVIDESMIFGRRLDAEEIATLYEEPWVQ